MTDTIQALSSGPPPSGVAVIRVSGPEAVAAVSAMLKGGMPPPRLAMLRSIIEPDSQQVIDSAVILYFSAPHSFTGEDVVELQCHGGVAVVAAVQRALSRLGVRPAEPGEFTRRAFESGRLDLTQAEALADLIAAETDAQRDQALANAGGRLRDRADAWRAELIGLLAQIEATLDFSDEADVAANTPEGQAPGNAQSGELRLADEIAMALSTAPLGERIRHGLTIAIVGPPNAGKSSLLNALARRDVAIVTPHAGTTRDVLEVHLSLAGRPVTLLDTAGLRETSDPIESEGIARARDRAAGADLLLDLGPDGNVVNKIDLIGMQPGYHEGRHHLSATSGEGLAEFETWLTKWAASRIPIGEPPLVTSARQVYLLEQTEARLRDANAQPDPVLKAESLRAAAHSLGRLTGQIDPEAVLGSIFGRFCIGK